MVERSPMSSSRNEFERRLGRAVFGVFSASSDAGGKGHAGILWRGIASCGVTLVAILSTLGVCCFGQVLQGAKPPLVPPPPLVLAGGTVIDVTEWGHSANDLHDAVIYVRDGRITAVGPRSALPIPKGSKVIDCTGKYLIPGLIDGFAGLSSQGQASAHLYMGVTTIVTGGVDHRGSIDMHGSPTPHIYLIDSIGSTDNGSLLFGRPEWVQKLREVNGRTSELSPEDTARQLTDTAKLGTKVLWLGHNLTAANTQWIIEHAHQIGLVTYGEFVSTPYRVAIEAGVDALLHMGRYELGVIPDELQQPLVEDPEGSGARTAYGYSERIPPNDRHLRDYALFLAAHRTALMPTFSEFYLRLPGHRNLWKEPAAELLDARLLSSPPDKKTGEAVYPLQNWQKRMPISSQRWIEEGLKRKADLQADRLWAINQSIFETNPHYLAGSGSPTMGTMPGISLHTELELLVRLGMSPREAVAAATNNYAEQFHWTELGQIAPGRRADILVLDADPTASIWNARRISTILLDGNQIERESLLVK